MDSSTYSSSVDSTIVVVGLIVALLFAIPSLITTWRLYSKADKPGWAAIVPVYNTIVMAEIAKKPLWMAIVAAVGGLLGGIPLLGIVLGLVGFVFAIIILIDFIKQYNGGVGFWVSYFLLPILAVFLVKKVDYKGGVAVAPAVPAEGAPVASPVAAPATADAAAAPEPVATPMCLPRQQQALSQL